MYEKTAEQERLCINRKDVSHHRIMKRWTVLICAVVAVFCWHPVGHVCCSEQRLAASQAQAQPLPQAQPTQDTSLLQDPSQEADAGQIVELSEAQETAPPSETSVPTEGSPVEEETWTLGPAYTGEQEQAPGTEVIVLAEEPVLEMEVAADTNGDPEFPVPEPQERPAQQPSAAITEPALALPASPSTADTTTLDSRASTSAPTSLESAVEGAPESLVGDPSAPPAPSTDSSPADCEALEGSSYSSVLKDLPAVLENTNASGGGKGTSTDVDAPAAQSGQGSNASSSMQKDKGTQIAKEVDSSAPTKDQEDIPTFDEWKKKMLEVEIEKSQITHTSANGGNHVAKKAQKNLQNNYASVECGAKILSSNPEAKSTSAILMENMDLYMLNPCSNKIWFVIELCEPIQVKKVDIANFELFSSTPKDFLVSISDRYPTNKWVKLGTFHARDERTVQSFPLDEHLFAKYVKMFTKYIKVELLSHFGSEHFCPLSLIRVFGTSMVEEYEEISDPLERTDTVDDDDDYPLGHVASEAKPSNNLIGSAKDVILNMVNNIAANVLGGSPEGNGTASAGNASDSSAAAAQTSPAATPSLQIESTGVSEADVKELPSTSTQETPTEETLSPEATGAPIMPSTALDSTPASSEVNQIVILLPADDGDSSGTPDTDAEGSGVLREATSEELTDARLRESSVYCEELSSSSSSSSCMASLQEHLLQQCSALLALQRRRRRCLGRPSNVTSTTSSSSTTTSSSSSSSPVSSEEQRISPTSPTLQEDSRSTRDLAPPPAQGSSLPEEPPPVSVLQPVADPLDLAPSLTPSLSETFSSDPPSHKSTPAMDLSESSVSDAQAEGGKETEAQRRKTPTPSSTVSSSLTTTTATDATGEGTSSGEERPAHTEVKQPGVEPEGSTPVLSGIVTDQTAPPSAPPSSLTEPPAHPAPEDRPRGAEEPPPLSPPLSPVSTETTDGLTATEEPKLEDLIEEAISQIRLSSSSASAVSGFTSSSSSAQDIFSEMANATEVAGGGGGGGVQGHGSGQKESVFMRLNNRIKALEMNMSLSGRYLEQLSQRYRKQMEEMQKAFNKTIIALQNTSRIAEEQDQRQTESILLLQGQLENITQLVLNLSVRVSQLQREVSDRQSYLLLCLVLCLLLGLVLCINHCCPASAPPTAQPGSAHTSNYTYCFPEGSLAGCDDELGLKRSASYPLLQSAFQIPTTEGPAEAYNVETSRNPLLNKKKRRCKVKQAQKKVETLQATVLPNLPLANGGPACCSGGVRTPVPHRDSPSPEGSSEGSSHSDEPSFCGVATCRRLCDSLPAEGRTRAEKRAYKRRRSKPSCGSVVEMPQAPRRRSDPVLSGSGGPVPSLQDLMKGKQEMSAGTLGATAISGPP